MARKQLQARVEDDDVEAIDNWRRKQKHIPSAAEAVRMLIRRGLEADGERRKKAASS